LHIWAKLGSRHSPECSRPELFLNLKIIWAKQSGTAQMAWMLLSWQEHPCWVRVAVPLCRQAHFENPIGMMLLHNKGKSRGRKGAAIIELQRQ